MQKIHVSDNDDVQRILEREGWAQPLPPVKKLTRLSWWHHIAFWALRVYVVAMLVVVVYAFTRGVR